MKCAPGCEDATNDSFDALQLDAAVSQPPLQAILVFVVFVGICDGIAQGAIFGDVALLPPKYTQVTFIVNFVKSCKMLSVAHSFASEIFCD